MLHSTSLEIFVTRKLYLIKKQLFMKRILCLLISSLILFSFKTGKKPAWAASINCVRISGNEINSIMGASGRDKMKRLILRFSVSDFNTANSQTTVHAFWVKKHKDHKETRDVALTPYAAPKNCLTVIAGDYLLGNNYVSIKRIEALLSRYDITGEYFLKFTPELDGKDVVFRMSVVKPDDTPYSFKRPVILGEDLTNPSPPKQPE
jgi:hypothetical protein